MPSFEKTNHHFQHGQADINVGLRGAEITSHIRLMQPAVSFGFGGLILVFTLRQGLFCSRLSLARV
jgi:hypothetical protein